MNLPTLQASYEPDQLLRHIDGGYYQYEKSVLFADDQDELVIYKHLWPFEESNWARRYSEFKDKFTPITVEDFQKAKQVEREVLQKQIEETRTNRRKAKQANK
jgi:hypothetical protein